MKTLEKSGNRSTDVIPATVVRALDEVKAAYQDHVLISRRFLVAVVELYRAKTREKYDALTGAEVARRVGCSPGYVSGVWNACEHSGLSPGRLTREAERLGYRELLRKYQRIERPRPTQAPKPGSVVRKTPVVPGLAPVEVRIDEVKVAISATLPGLTSEQKEELLIELLDLVGIVRDAIPKTMAQRRALNVQPH